MWPDSSATDRLLQDAAGGNPAAASDLLEQHRAALRRMIAVRLDRGVARRIDASDVVQDVLLEASKRLADYLQDPRMPFHLWLRHLALDRMIDLHRRHHAQRRDVGRERALQAGSLSGKSSLDLAAQLQDQELTPAAAAIRKELAGRFLAALDDMDEPDREIILLRHVEQLGNSEAAEALGLAPAAAGMRYLRALRRLRTMLGEPPSAG
ncbi:MAG: sigma-70 family RNA polymerase sigma factor [Planctomycetaceae bacterium]|nr:sigma-70 family RNA polymerase sigma factor [Planctomycetaceae bacterium]